MLGRGLMVGALRIRERGKQPRGANKRATVDLSYQHQSVSARPRQSEHAKPNAAPSGPVYHARSRRKVADRGKHLGDVAKLLGRLRRPDNRRRGGAADVKARENPERPCQVPGEADRLVLRSGTAPERSRTRQRHTHTAFATIEQQTVERMQQLLQEARAARNLGLSPRGCGGPCTPSSAPRPRE